MRQITLHRTKDLTKTFTLTVSIYADQLVFTAGSYYPPLDGGDFRDDGRECDDYLIVEIDYKTTMLKLLQKELQSDSQEPSESDVDLLLLQSVQSVASHKQWQSLSKIETWLVEKDIPFKKDRWLTIG
ncbi:MAG: hypothetical protein DWQ04_35000 [Chloroflexi bacterium]|nr:MAG: hypothetical protein DWQ04_35000 [Chloroflexota bacterium]